MVGNIAYDEMKRKTSNAYQAAKTDNAKEDMKGREAKNNPRPDLTEQVNNLFIPENKLFFTKEEWEAVQEKVEAAEKEALWQRSNGKLNVQA